MTEKRILAAVEACKAKFVGCPPVRLRDDVETPLSWEQRSHLHWMCLRIPEFLREGRREKVMRWLGFIQGTMWVLGDFTIAEMKKHNMPTPEEAEAERLREEAERAEKERRIGVLRQMGEQTEELTQQILEETGMKAVDNKGNDG